MNQLNHDTFSDVTVTPQTREKIHQALDTHAAASRTQAAAPHTHNPAARTHSPAPGTHTVSPHAADTPVPRAAHPPASRAKPQLRWRITALGAAFALILGVTLGIATKGGLFDKLNPPTRSLTVHAFVAGLEPDEDIYQALLASDLLNRDQRHRLDEMMSQGSLPDSHKRLEALQAVGLYGKNRLPSRAEVIEIIAASPEYIPARNALIAAIGPPSWDSAPVFANGGWWPEHYSFAPETCYYLDDGSALMILNGSYFIWGDWEKAFDGRDILVLEYNGAGISQDPKLLARVLESLRIKNGHELLSFAPDPDHPEESRTLQALLNPLYNVRYTGDASMFPRETTPWSIWAIARQFQMIHANFMADDEHFGENWPGEAGGIHCLSVAYEDPTLDYAPPQGMTSVYVTFWSEYHWYIAGLPQHEANMMGDFFLVRFEDGKITHLETYGDMLRDIFRLVALEQDQRAQAGQPPMTDAEIKDFLEGPGGNGVIG